MNQLFNEECLQGMRKLPSDSVDAIITDPPYSSGGTMRSDRAGTTTARKYCQSGNALGRPDFSGDNRDQRSWTLWMSLWMEEAMRVLKPGGYMVVFTDWRQLPATTDAIQCAGAVWRGLASWDKGPSARAPHKGYFRHQCEYIVWGSKGALAVPAADGIHTGPFPGSFSIPVRQADKYHQTGKPTELMRELVRIVSPGGLILDPFMGSGTTAVAALLEGRQYVGFEREKAYYEIAQNRIADFHRQKQLV